jgi:hypothetical protein
MEEMHKMVFKAAGAGIRGVTGTYKFGKRLGRETGAAYKRGGATSAAYKATGMLGSVPMKIINESAKDVLKPSGKFWSILSKNKTILGINVGVGSFLKQSQVFTGAMSSLLQIVGAIIDVAIAPWLIPLFIPLAKKMASAIPKIREWSQDLAEKYVPLIKEKLSAIWNGEGNFMQKIWDSVKSVVGLVWEESGLSDWWAKSEGIIRFFRESIELVVDVLRFMGLIKTPATTSKTQATNKESFISGYRGMYEGYNDRGFFTSGNDAAGRFDKRMKGYEDLKTNRFAGDPNMNPYGAGGLGPGFSRQGGTPGATSGIGGAGMDPNNLAQGIQASWGRRTMDSVTGFFDDTADFFSSIKLPWG